MKTKTKTKTMMKMRMKTCMKKDKVGCQEDTVMKTMRTKTHTTPQEEKARSHQATNRTNTDIEESSILNTRMIQMPQVYRDLISSWRRLLMETSEDIDLKNLVAEVDLEIEEEVAAQASNRDTVAPPMEDTSMRREKMILKHQAWEVQTSLWRKHLTEILEDTVHKNFKREVEEAEVKENQDLQDKGKEVNHQDKVIPQVKDNPHQDKDNPDLVVKVEVHSEVEAP